MEIKRTCSTNFKAAIPTAYKADFTSTILSAKKILGINNGLSLLKLHSGSMPRQKNYDSGIGKLNSVEEVVQKAWTTSLKIGKIKRLE